MNNSIETYLINNIQFANIVFIFIAFIILLYFIVLGIINGKKKFLNNKHFYIAFVIGVICIFLYYPFYSLVSSNVAWYIVRFLGILFVIYVVLISEVGKYINYKKYNELNINNPDNKDYVFTDIEKIILYSLSSICILCFFLLSSQLLLISGGFHYTSNVSRFIETYNTIGPGYYIEFIIVSILLIILYFLVKGLFLSSLKKLYNYLYVYIFFIAINAVFVILLWPPYNPDFTVFIWHVVHFFGIVYLLEIIYFTSKVERHAKSTFNDDVKINTLKTYLHMTKRREICFYILSITCILILIFSVIAQFIQMLGILNYRYFVYPHPFAFIWLIGYIPIIILFCYSIKFLKICKSKKLKLKIRICFCFFILFLFIFFPYPYIYIPQFVWIIFDLIGIYIYIYFYTICMKSSSSNSN
ncbi:MAG: hypothetical protein GY756_08250 [bacterium]|nr:hypothetical protein [bacterium]